MADRRERPKVRAKQANEGNGGSLVLNITAMVLVVIAFLLHNWTAQNSTPHAVQQPAPPPAPAAAASP